MIVGVWELEAMNEWTEIMNTASEILITIPDMNSDSHHDMYSQFDMYSQQYDIS